MSKHRRYLNEVLGDYYCVECGDEWPCLPNRQLTQCRCGHDQALHDEVGCVIFVCGCRAYRPKQVAA